MPTAPAAPVLLTTPTGFLSTFSRAAATGRAVRSATPPGGNGATIVMGREGYGSWAAVREPPSNTRKARAARATEPRRLIPLGIRPARADSRRDRGSTGSRDRPSRWARGEE